MRSQHYVAISAQLSLQRRLDTLANNIANVSTAGYRADEISFEQIVSRSGAEPVSYVSRGKDHISLKSGETTRTGNPLDVAIRGQAWLMIQSGDSNAYTRDGRLAMTETGALTNQTGDAVLDSSGSPIQLDPAAPAPNISADGTITQGTRRIATLGLFTMDPTAKMVRGPASSVIPDVAATPELDFNRNGIVQGFVEKSNVNPMHEMTRLIAIQRTFEAVNSMIQESESAQQEATRALSGA